MIKIVIIIYPVEIETKQSMNIITEEHLSDRVVDMKTVDEAFIK